MIHKKDLAAILGLMGITLILVILINPVFHAALDDSWNFALPTKHFIETGVPVFDPFNSAASVPHILWGGFFCWIFGFSFSVCRISNIVLALVASIIFYFAARQVTSNRKTAFAIAVTFTTNPILMVTSYTFQSDIAYLVSVFGATAFYLRYLKTKNQWHLFWATIIAAISVWNKLHGILIPVGAFIYFLITFRDCGIKRKTWVAITAIPAASFLLFKLAKPVIHPASTTLDGKMTEFGQRVFSPEVWLFEGSWRLFFIIVAVGLYALPLLVGWLFYRRKAEDDYPLWSKIVVGVFWLAIIKIAFIYLGMGQGYAEGDTIFPFHSSMLRELPALPHFWALDLLSWLAWPAGAILGYHLTFEAIDSLRKRDASLLLFALLLPQVLILVPIKLFMDRYFLVIFPLVFLLLARRFFNSKFYLWISMILIVLSFIFGATRISQYSSANTAQWQGAKTLTDKGVSNLNIDAGYPWTGWNNYEHSLANPKIDKSKPGDHWYIFELCKTTDVKYLVTFWPPTDESSVMDTVEYRYWFVKEPQKVYVWKKENAVPTTEPIQ